MQVEEVYQKEQRPVGHLTEVFDRPIHGDVGATHLVVSRAVKIVGIEAAIEAELGLEKRRVDEGHRLVATLLEELGKSRYRGMDRAHVC